MFDPAARQASEGGISTGRRRPTSQPPGGGPGVPASGHIHLQCRDQVLATPEPFVGGGTANRTVTTLRRGRSLELADNPTLQGATEDNLRDRFETV